MTPFQGFILAEVRSWIGTPYRHQASVRGSGADCLGLLRGVWRAAFGEEPETVPAYTADWAEPSGREVLQLAADRHFLRKSLLDAAPADVLLFRMKDTGIAKHLGICGEVGARSSFIHAYTGHGVLESPLSEPWERRIVARYAFHDRMS